MSSLFDKKTLIEHANSLAQFFPLGKIFASKNDPNSNLRKLINAFSGEVKRVYDGLNDISADYDIDNTVEFVEKWESAVGIPDDCFKATGSLAERRTHILLKLAKMNVQTSPDFVELARSLGFEDVEVYALSEASYPPYDVPFIPTSSPASRFTIVVYGTNVVSDVPPYDVPFTPAANNKSTLKCVFEDIRPSNCNVIYINKAEDSAPQFDIIDQIALRLSGLDEDNFYSPLNNKILDLKMDAENVTIVDTDKVSYLTDSSPHSQDLDQTVSANRAVYSQDAFAIGKHGITFDSSADGGNGQWLSGGLSGLTDYPFSIFAVMRVRQNINRGALLSLVDSSASNKFFSLNVDTFEKGEIAARNSGTQYLDNGITDLGNPPYETSFVLTAQFLSATQRKLLVSTDVEAIGTDNVPFVDTLDLIGFGKVLDSSPAWPSDMIQGRTLIFRGNVPDDDRDTIISELESEHGI